MHSASDNNSSVRFCAAAVIDLLGFSAHLEAGGHDMRTTIGRAAVDRLDSLESARDYITRERHTRPDVYPVGLQVGRINDALILHLDLPDRLRPRTGRTTRRGFTGHELAEQFNMERYLDDEEGSERFSKDYLAGLRSDVQDLVRFLGLVARLHLFVNSLEHSHSFPGAKTVCASGLRRRYERGEGQEEWLSANFAFANAFVADAHLHGPRFFVDDALTELVCIDEYARNLVRFSSFVRRNAPFDMAEDPFEGFYEPGISLPSDPKEIDLFRKTFYFRELSPGPLTHLQVLDAVRPYLNGDKEPAPDGLFNWVVSELRRGPDLERFRKGELSARLPFSLDLTFPVDEYLEIVELGRSPTREKRQNEESMTTMLRGLPLHTEADGGQA